MNYGSKFADINKDENRLMEAERNKRRESTRKANLPNNRKTTQDLKQREEDSFFWQCVKDAASNKLKKKVTISESKLFGSPTDQGPAIEIDQYDGVKVTRVGPKTDDIPILNSFDALQKRLPAFLMKNIIRMRYKSPTPIQKH
eukprot:gene47887-64247_t